MSKLQIKAHAGTDPAIVGDIQHFIYKTFMRSLRDGNDWYRAIDQDIYYYRYKQVIDALLARANTRIYIASLEDDPDNYLGWSLYEDDRLHYVFLKTYARHKHGIARQLIKPKFSEITHLTKIGRAIWKAKFPEAIFNPFL